MLLGHEPFRLLVLVTPRTHRKLKGWWTLVGESTTRALLSMCLGYHLVAYREVALTSAYGKRWTNQYRKSAKSRASIEGLGPSSRPAGRRGHPDRIIPSTLLGRPNSKGPYLFFGSRQPTGSLTARRVDLKKVGWFGGITLRYAVVMSSPMCRKLSWRM